MPKKLNFWLVSSLQIPLIKLFSKVWTKKFPPEICEFLFSAGVQALQAKLAQFLEGDAKKIALAKKVTISKKSTIFILFV